MMHNPKVLEVEFSVALVRLLRHFNRLELNLGLSISRLWNPSDPKSAYSTLANMSLEQKLKEFRRLLVERTETTDNGRSDVETWIARANDARGVRNLYVHGHWDLLPLRTDQPVSLYAPPWMRQRLGLESELKMSLSELQDMATHMEDLSQDFVKLRRRLGV